MKTPLILSFIFLLSCSDELPELRITPRSDYITYSPGIGCVDQEVTVTFNNGYGNNCGTSKLQQFRNGNWHTVAQATPQNGMITYSFFPGVAGEYRFRASWNKTGKDCNGENIKPFEEDPLVVENDCCTDYFTATGVCNISHHCQYGVEFHFSTSVDNWIAIIGQFPEGYELCGFYDEFGNIIEVYSGNHIEISGDFYACMDIKFYVYFNSRDTSPSFGTWMVKDMQGVLYNVLATPCQ